MNFDLTNLSESEIRLLDSVLLESYDRANKVARDNDYTDTVRHVAEVKRDECRRMRHKILSAVRAKVPQ